MQKPLAAVILVCEKVLNEKDGVLSVIRIPDLFYVHSPPDLAPENQAVLMTVLIMCKFPHDDESTHSVLCRLKRPDGTEKDVDFGVPLEFPLKDNKEGPTTSPRGFNLIASWGVKPTHTGLHELILLVDGNEISSAFFTLLPLPLPPPSN